MPNAFTPIPLVQKGGVSLVSAEYANKLIVPLNAIMAGRIVPITGVGSIFYSGDQFILDLSQLDARMRAVEGRLNNANITANGSCSGNNITINISLNI